MKTKKLLAIALIALAAGCARHQGPPAFTITDDTGRRVGLNYSPKRIVSLAPSVTEMIFGLHGQDKLVGVTSWCDYPAAAKEKPVVGDAVSFNTEKLLALKPDLVIMVGTRQSPALTRLEALRIPVLALDPKTPEQVIADLITVGRALDAQRAADSMAGELRALLAQVARSTDSVPASGRPLVFAEIGDAPLYTAGPKSFIGRMIALAGGRNAIDLSQDYAALNPETVIARNPDIIIILHPMAKKADVMKRIGWSNIRAVKNGRVYDGLDLDVLLRPGPRFVLGLLELRRIIHERAR